MELHHTKHHRAYVDNLNTALEKYPHLFELSLENLLANLASLPEEIRMAVRNHGGGHYNHSLFWRVMGEDRNEEPSGEFTEALNRTFGSLQNFRERFEKEAAARFGSGWVWLSVNALGELIVHSAANQDSPIMEGLIPVLGLDLWEHAYYLTHQNRRGDYIKAFWNVVNWREVEKNYSQALRDIGSCLTPAALRKVS